METEKDLFKGMLGKAKVSAFDSIRFVKNILDAKPSNSPLTDIQFVAKVIEVGLRNIRNTEKSFEDGFKIYLESKQHLRPDSIRDIRCIGNRLIRTNPELARRNFSELSAATCDEWINAAFTTAPQQNKARAMLHALFNFALRRDWSDSNPIDKIERRRTIEKQIDPLTLAQIRRLLKTAATYNNGEFTAAAALLIYAGIRPREVRRLTWRDIDTEENTITVRPHCSKTGGTRQVEIPPTLRKIIIKTSSTSAEEEKICPTSWEYHWRKIRNSSGFGGHWAQDVLRHTYASFHAKHYANLPRLQLNMGHRDLALLRSRYINMRGISKQEARKFFHTPLNI